MALVAGVPRDPAGAVICIPWLRVAGVGDRGHMRKINLILVHCSATPAAMDVGVREIRAWHTLPPPKGNGWADIGYHFVIRRDGTVETGRPIAQTGAHAAGHNAHSIGVCLVGGVDTGGPKGQAVNNFTAAQFKSLKKLLVQLQKDHPGVARILGHRDVQPGKACPSFSVRDWLAANGFGTPAWT